MFHSLKENFFLYQALVTPVKQPLRRTLVLVNQYAATCLIPNVITVFREEQSILPYKISGSEAPQWIDAINHLLFSLVLTQMKQKVKTPTSPRLKQVNDTRELKTFITVPQKPN